MRFKVGDRVKIKGLDSYNANKNKDGHVLHGDNYLFSGYMSRFLGCEAVVDSVCLDAYGLIINGHISNYFFCDYMLEQPIEQVVESFEEPTEEPCGYCNGTKVIVADQKYDQTWAAVSDGCLHLENSESCYSEKINFCPMCGRKLNND